MTSTQGKNNKLLKKIYKALKMPQDSTYLEDIVHIAENADDISNNAAAISMHYSFCLIESVETCL